MRKGHKWKTRADPFESSWEEVKELLEREPSLEALTVLNYLMDKYPGRFQNKQLRTLQRRFRDWRAINGKEKEIIFSQDKATNFL